MNYNSTIPDFETLIERLKPDLQKVEDFRCQKWKRTFLITLLLVGVVVGFYGIDRTYFSHKEYVIVTIAGYVCTMILCGTIWIQSEKVGIEYKRQIISSFVKNIIKNGRFIPESGIPEKDFVNSNLFTKPDRYSSEDLVTGRIGEIKIAFSEVYAQERITMDTVKKNNSKYYKDIFRGFIFTATFPKEFKSRIEIKRNEILASKENRVYLEDPYFESLFNTYCPDQIEARYILTPSMMNRICNIEQKFRNKKMMLTFHDSQLLIAIADRTNHFEANIWQSIFNTKKLKREYNILKTFTEIVEDLNLNQQIWKKQDNE